MPVYEYVCTDCDTKFEQLRPLSKMDDAASCPRGHPTGQRVLSIFAAMTRDASGEAVQVGGGCGGCGGGCTNCACSAN
jgi:putative FmdB family regulatory protein